MKFGCSLEMVNMLTSGPNFIFKQSKKFWVDYFKYIAAVGFQGVELPFNPFNSDPMAFEMGRCGIPCNATAVAAKYGSSEQFLQFLNEVGIEEITGIHMSANDAMLELIASNQPKENYFTLLKEMGVQAIAHGVSLKTKGLIVSPTPEIGWIERVFGANETAHFEEKTIQILKEIAVLAKEAGVVLALKTEYWSLFRGGKMAEVLKQLEGAFLCPDLAHLQIAKDPVVTVVEAHKNEIAYLRLSDTAFEDRYENYKKINAELPVQGAQKVFCDLGEGKVDLKGVIKVLDDNQYDGYVICEQKKTLDVYRGLLKMGWFVHHELMKSSGQEV